MEVYNTLGAGFLEEVYQEALERELVSSGIPYEREVPLGVVYKGQLLKKRYFADFVCYGKIIVELKAVSALTDAHCAQVVNYLRATGYQLGLLMNFGNTERLQYVRRVNTVGGNLNTNGVEQNTNERESGECTRMGRGNWGTPPGPRETFAGIRRISGDSRSEVGGRSRTRMSANLANVREWGEKVCEDLQDSCDSRSETGGEA